MDEKERHARGMARRRQVLGNAWVDRANAKKTPFNAEFQDFITRAAWGEIWTRGELERTTIYPSGHYVTPQERLARAIQGNATSSEALETGKRARPMAEAGWRQVEQMQARRAG